MIAKGIDCITNLTDNTVVGALDIIIAKTNAAKIPVFGSEIDQVKKGCLASASLDYVALGEQTGRIMAKILKGEIKASNDYTKYNGVPWKNIKGMRDKVAHEYGTIDLDQVWNAATNDIRSLREYCEKILNEN